MEVPDSTEAPKITFEDFNDSHIWGARIILHKLLAESRQNWNSFGFRLWAERQLLELDKMEDEYFNQ